MSAPYSQAAVVPERQSFYERMGSRAYAPLWEVLSRIAPPEPRPSSKAHLWAWPETREFLMEAGQLLTAEEAVRRALMLENPAFTDKAKVTTTLTAAVQLVLPGEVAPAHRHTQTAIRFVLESDGGFTTVAGERSTMAFGDFLITPSAAFHDHGNHGKGPLIFLDVLDSPINALFETGFSGRHNADQQAVVRREGDAMARFGSGLLPMDARSPYGLASPVFNYPYARTRPALLDAAQGAAPDPHWGFTLRFANPVDGGWPTPALANWMTYLPPGFTTAPIRSTDAQLVVAAEGAGEAVSGDESLRFRDKDTFVLPNWTWRRITAGPQGCILFVTSDRAAQEKLGLWREERQPAV